MKTKFYTGAGDKGRSVMGKKSYEKDDSFFEFLGTIDELNSWLGFCRVTLKTNSMKNQLDIGGELIKVQENLFVIQAEIAGIFFAAPKYPKLQTSATSHMEDVIKKIDAVLPPLTKFIIPGGSEASAKLDVVRALTRRAERLAVGYSKKGRLSVEILQYLNRLSSLLFALSRYENFRLKINEKNPTYS